MHSQGPSEQKPIQNFGEKGASAYPRTAQFLVPPIILGTGKATNFKFFTHIHRINRNKSPLKISRKVVVGVLRDSGKFSGQRIQGASRGHFCDSSAFLLFFVSPFYRAISSLSDAPETLRLPLTSSLPPPFLLLSHVDRHWARLVLGWVTACGRVNHLGM